MNNENVSLKVEFQHSEERALIPLEQLIDKTIEFLEYFGDESILGEEIYAHTGSEDGETKFTNLLRATNYENNPQGFFEELLSQLETSNSTQKNPIAVKGLELSYLLVLSILEIIIPGNGFVTVKNVKQLKKLTNITFSKDETKTLQEVIETYPVRFSKHTIRQMRISPAIAYQYMPFTDELSNKGEVHTWVGQFHRGIVEQMYENRIIFILNMACPVYCRFCFRKHKECRNQKSPNQSHVKEAASYVKETPTIKEVVLTGGDPFMNKSTLTLAIDSLKNISHLQSLRIATRSISYYPHLFYANNNYWLNYLKSKQLEVRAKGKRIEIATHFIHPDEISLESLDIISDLSKNGIPVYVQTPLLNHCNDTVEPLEELYRKLRGAGAEMHYIYIPCSPIKGNMVYVSPISTGINLAAGLRAELSDRAIPRICTATKIGKIDWNLSGWAVEQDTENPKEIWLRTPYTEEYLRSFAPILQLSDFARVNAEGTLDVKFMADIGDEELFLGPRQPQTLNTVYPPEQEISENTDKTTEALEQLKLEALADQRFNYSIVDQTPDGLLRLHKTRVEIDLDIEPLLMENCISYIANNKEITDVVISGKNDVLDSLYKLCKIIEKLDVVPHVNAIRLRSLKFNYSPKMFSRSLINKLGNYNRLTIVNPKRIEIETQFLHSDEIKPEHGIITAKLKSRGITVYNNTPLLPFLNDTKEEILNITYKCRENGIEFHHFYIAGLPVQQKWEEKYPATISNVIDIATHVRRYGSGREIPRFIIYTPLGEVDFGLTSEIFDTDNEGRIYLLLKPYKLEYFKAMLEAYEWPEGVKVHSSGHPLILIPGLKKMQEFLVD